MRYASHERSSFKPILIILVAALAASGYFIFTLYTETQNQASTIADQSQKIGELESTIEQRNSLISDQQSQISELDAEVGELSAQVLDLGERLGIAQEEIGELSPKITNYFVVGVRSDGKGVVVPVQVKVVKGNGAISVNINRVEFRSGTQDSIRTGAVVASLETGVPISDKDITVSFVNTGEDIVTVDGGSAGAAITVAIMATLLDRDINTGVMMTGTISIQRNVGPVGSVSAKAEAARDSGAHTFLVPKGQGVGVSGIAVTEVENINDAADRIIL